MLWSKGKMSCYLLWKLFQNYYSLRIRTTGFVLPSIQEAAQDLQNTELNTKDPTYLQKSYGSFLQSLCEMEEITQGLHQMGICSRT